MQCQRGGSHSKVSIVRWLPAPVKLGEKQASQVESLEQQLSFPRAISLTDGVAVGFLSQGQPTRAARCGPDFVVVGFSGWKKYLYRTLLLDFPIAGEELSSRRMGKR